MPDKSLTTLQHKVLQILLDETRETKRLTAHAILDRIGLAEFGSQNLRSLQAMKKMADIINILRSKGYPICSSHLGFFYARRDETVTDFIAKQRAKIIPILKIISDMEKTYPNVGEIQNSLKFKVTLPTRTPLGVKYMEFEIGEDGKPIIPPDIDLI